MTRWQFIKYEWLRVSVMLLVTASLPFMAGYENPAGMDPFPIFTFLCILFWLPFIGFMLSEGMRKEFFGINKGDNND